MNPRSKVLVADPDPGIRRLIQRRLRTFGAVAAEAGTLMEAVSAVASWRPDTVVAAADLDDPLAARANTVLRQIKGAMTGLPVLCLVPQTASDAVPYLLDQGADDCLVKPFLASELAARLHRLLRRQDVVARPALLAGTALRQLKVLAQAGCVETDRGRVDLTARQLHVLTALVRADGAAVGYATIIDEVWGAGYAGSIQILQRTIAALRRRVEPVPAEPTLIVTVRGIGYRFGSPK